MVGRCFVSGLQIAVCRCSRITSLQFQTHFQLCSTKCRWCCHRRATSSGKLAAGHFRNGGKRWTSSVFGLKPPFSDPVNSINFSWFGIWPHRIRMNMATIKGKSQHRENPIQNHHHIKSQLIATQRNSVKKKHFFSFNTGHQNEGKEFIHFPPQIFETLKKSAKRTDKEQYIKKKSVANATIGVPMSMATPHTISIKLRLKRIQ